MRNLKGAARGLGVRVRCRSGRQDDLPSVKALSKARQEIVKTAWGQADATAVVHLSSRLGEFRICLSPTHAKIHAEH